MMHTVNFCNKTDAPEVEQTASDGRQYVSIAPDVVGVILYFAQVARADEVEYEFAIACIVHSFGVDPELARGMIDVLAKRTRDSSERLVEVDVERERIVVRIQHETSWRPRISREAAGRYWTTLLAAVKAARDLKGRVAEAEIRAAEAEARAEQYGQALDEALSGKGAS